MASRWIGSFFLPRLHSHFPFLLALTFWNANIIISICSTQLRYLLFFSLTNEMKILSECPSVISSHLMLTKVDNEREKEMFCDKEARWNLLVWFKLENWKFKNIKIIIENPFAIPTMCYVFIVEKIGFFFIPLMYAHISTQYECVALW